MKQFQVWCGVNGDCFVALEVLKRVRTAVDEMMHRVCDTGALHPEEIKDLSEHYVAAVQGLHVSIGALESACEVSKAEHKRLVAADE